ncbi:MAG: folate-binding protein YgfZ [Thiobacillaceae bacterium]|nr:folate-binding protein YgfZ [Thiobacillaceae bacterium]MCX7672113.1 folate-binding protein YgfZ [Thiobacillaceae bacterium]MDW8323139.1 folate-binding protein YgfZ [Burkholderiales bacterium]
MNSTWSEYLPTQGAVLAGDRVLHFGDPQGELQAAQTALVVADLSHYGLIALTGEEAQAFLHGQITNDLRPLTDAQAVYAGYCSAKGRLLANFLVFRRGGTLYLLLPRVLSEPIRRRLSMFVLRSRVKLADAGDDWVILGLNGPGAQALVSAHFGVIPPEPMSVVHTDSGWAVRLAPDRFDLVVAPPAAPALWQALRAQARPVGAPAWDWLMVRAGVPVILPATQDQFVPQMVNLEVLGGVSFHKGCYPGQEIVARSQYLGKLKRRMYLAHVDAEAAAGTELYSPDLPGQACGQVINAAPAPEGGTDVLAVMQVTSHEAGEVHLGAADGPRLAFLPLPYALPA